MPFPALAALLPYLGAGAAGLAGGAIGSSLAGQGNNNQQSGEIGSQGNFFTGSPSRIHQLPRFNPQQIGLLNQIGQQGFQGLQGNKFDFAPIEQQARQDFERKTIPSIAQRFSNVGGGVNSGAYGRQLASAGKDLELGLSGLKQGYNLQQQGFNKDLLNLGLTPQYDTKIEAAAPGFGQNFASGLGQGLPDLLKLLSLYLGGNK